VPPRFRKPERPGEQERRHSPTQQRVVPGLEYTVVRVAAN
jgi:hypothetical protein